ncbi:hypothetical protein HQ403_00915 [Candidatus Kaiserbacteria bacterium]|nr:hypothetical protein [Candidatus Kaiserbacteria bacterium]
MQTIVNFLKKFSNIEPTARVVKKVAYSVFNERHIPITEDEIIYNNNIVYIKSNQVVKNEVFMLKANLLKEIENKLNKRTVTDIR